MKVNKIFLAILIIIIIIQICIAVVLLNYKRIDSNYVLTPTSDRFISTEENRKTGLTVLNASEFLKLNTANVKKVEIIHIVNEYVTGVLPVAYSSQNITEEELKQKYEENVDEYEKCGLYSYKDFYSIIDMVKEKNIDFTEYESVQFLSTKVEDEELIVSTSIMFTDGKFLTMNVIFVDGFAEGIELK